MTTKTSAKHHEFRTGKGVKREGDFFTTCSIGEPQLELCKKCTMIDDCPMRKVALENRGQN